MSAPTQGDWIVSRPDRGSDHGEYRVRAAHILVATEEFSPRIAGLGAPNPSGNMPLAAMAKQLRTILETIANYPATDVQALAVIKTLAGAMVSKMEDARIIGNYSPSPWHVGQSTWPRFRRDILDAEGRVIACCTTQSNKLEEVVANAEMIRAAPDALEALQAIVAFPETDPVRAANCVQVLALSALYPEKTFSGIENINRAREIAGLKRAETPYSASLRQMQTRFNGAMPGPWKYVYINSTQGSLMGGTPERRFALLINASVQTRSLVLAAPTLRSGLSKAIDALEHLNATGDVGTKAYSLRILRSLATPMPQLWRAVPTNDGGNEHNLLDNNGLPAGRIKEVQAGDLELIVAAPALARSLEYAASALEAIEEKAESPLSREYASTILNGREGLKALLKLPDSGDRRIAERSRSPSP